MVVSCIKTLIFSTKKRKVTKNQTVTEKSAQNTNNLEILRKNSKIKITNLFENYLDLSYAMSLAQELETKKEGIRIPSQLKLIGAGCDSSAFQIQANLPNKFSLFSLVLNRSHFILDDLAYERQKKTLKFLRTKSNSNSNWPLISPLEVFELNKRLYWIQPFGDSSGALACWQNLDYWQKELNKLLNLHQLKFNDLIQIRYCLGVPFVIDISSIVPCINTHL